MTNDEIIVKLLQKVLSKDEKDHIRHSTFIAFVQMLNEARSDNAKQIFKELDKYQVEQQYCITHVDIGIGDYNDLKKKYKVNEK